MDFRIGVDPETGWGRVDVSGNIALDDLYRLFAAAWEHPDYARAELAVWHIFKARTTMRFDDLMQLTHWLVANKKGRGPKRIAIVAHDDVTFGMSRMFDNLQQEFGWEVQVFRSAATANEWLRTHSGA